MVSKKNVKGFGERREFYTKAIHILFAIVLGHSFLLAIGTIIPIQIAFNSNYHLSMTLIFSYVVIVSGWIGYARSVSYAPHKDTVWGAIRFVLDIVIIYEYFYLLRISQTEYVTDIPYVMVVIFGTYALSDLVKYYEHVPQGRTRIKRRGRITVHAFILSILIAIWYYSDDLGLVAIYDVDALDLSIVGFFIILILFRVYKWKLTTKRK